MAQVVKVFSRRGEELTTFVGGPEIERAIAEAREYAHDGCQIEVWDVYQMLPNRKNRDVALAPEGSE